MKLLELFGGIGACSKAFKRLGIPIEIADYVEIDKYAVKSYNAINGTNFEPQDITKWDKDIDVDFIMHGSPCQDFSVAGLNKGGDEGSGTRSSLMYETIRIVEKLKPKYVLWENVKNLLSKKHIHNFRKYIQTMSELGYNSYYQVLNSKDYGIPQNRERVFTLSIRQDIDNGTFIFPKPFELKLKLKDMLENEVDEKYYLSDKMMAYISQSGTKDFKLNDSKINLDIARPLTTDQNKRAGTTNYLSDDLPDNFSINKIITHNISQIVKIRKFPVDTKKLKETLRVAKLNMNLNNKDIAEKLNLPKTQVEHWFRNDDSFAIPLPEIWLKLKEILGIKTDEFDESIMTFEEKEGIYDKANRVYDEEGVSPTLTQQEEKILIKNNTKLGYQVAVGGDGIDLENVNSKTRRGRVQKGMAQTLNTQDNKGVVVGYVEKKYKKFNNEKGYIPEMFNPYNESEIKEIAPTQSTNCGSTTSSATILKKEGLRIRKLTPKECWRLMGFDDSDFEKAEKVNSNAQLYKQAGNSIVVNVLEKILENLFLKDQNDFEGQISFDMLGDKI